MGNAIYRAVVGVHYVPEGGTEPVKRRAGQALDGLGQVAIEAFLAVGAIERIEAPAQAGGRLPVTGEANASAPASESPGLAAYHADGGKVHHTLAACKQGNNIEPDTRRDGTGGLPKCRECARLEREEE